MSLGGGAGGSSTKSSTTATTNQTGTTATPWTQFLPQVSSTLTSGLNSLGSGSTVADTIKALTASTNLQTTQGVGNIKEAFGASGMRFSSSLANSLAQFQTSQTTALNSGIASAEMQGAQSQLAALQEIISLASGSGSSSATGSSTQNTTGSSFGWDIAASFGKAAPTH